MIEWLMFGALGFLLGCLLALMLAPPLWNRAVKLTTRRLEATMPIRSAHHDDVDFDSFQRVDAVHPWTLDRRLAFDRHAERAEKRDSGWKVVDDDADVVQSLDRHVPNRNIPNAFRS